jgi:hypothetical protein
LVVAVLLEKLGVVLEYGHHHATQRFVVLDAGILFVRVLLRVLISPIGCNAARDLLGNELVHPVGVRPRDVAELIIEDLEDVGESV